jgi:hypothetical protein
MVDKDPDKLYGDLAAKIEPQDFELEETPSELQGLTSQTLFDLYDQVNKWGNPYGETGKSMDLYNRQAGWGIHVSVSPFTRMMSVLKIDENEVVETTEGIFTLKPKKGVVVWDRRLTVEQVEEALSAHDEIAKGAEHINPDSGERLYKETSSS